MCVMEGNGSKRDDNFSSSRSKRTRTNIIPNDMVIEILERLPVKSLLRFECVSKWWYDLIRDPKFFDNHLEKGTRRKLLLVKRRLLQQGDVLSLHDLDSPELEEVPPYVSLAFLKDLESDYTDEGLHASFHCLGGLWSKGIVCIMYNGGIALCNPAFSEFKLLPPCQPVFPQGFYEGVLAAGFGITRSGEFKVILIHASIIYSTARTLPNTFPVPLYSSSTNSWKQIGDISYVPFSLNRADQLFFNGACHWLAVKNKDHLSSKILLSFNTTTEVLRPLDLPHFYEDCIFARPPVVKECLGIIRCNSQSLSPLELWVMEYGIKESWSKQFVMKHQSDNLFVYNFLEWENDQWLFMETRNGDQDAKTNAQLTCYSSLTNEVKRYQVYGVKHSMRSLVFEESLVRLT